jgi:hypothetical protein
MFKILYFLSLKLLQRIHPRPCIAINKTDFYSEKLLAQCSTPKLEDHSLLPILTADSKYLQFIPPLIICHIQDILLHRTINSYILLDESGVSEFSMGALKFGEISTPYIGRQFCHCFIGLLYLLLFISL